MACRRRPELAGGELSTGGPCPADARRMASHPPLPGFAARARACSDRVASLGTVFVLGCQKSGTTWLQLLLDAHPEIALNGEGHFTSVLVPVIVKAIETHNAQAKAVFKLDNDDALACLRGLIDRTLSRYVDSKLAPERVRWVGDKTPEAAVSIPLLETLYPGSRFIHVIRDGRDGVVSGWAHLTRDNNTSRFATVADYAEYFATGHWTSYITLARRAGAELGPSRYMEVRYEDLHADAARETERMLRFLGVDHAPEAIEACVKGGSFERLTGGRSRGERDAKSHFRNGQIGEFLTSLPEDAIARFERAALPLMRELGYPPAAAIAR